jgi:hypothetical protein
MLLYPSVKEDSNESLLSADDRFHDAKRKPVDKKKLGTYLFFFHLETIRD